MNLLSRLAQDVGLMLRRPPRQQYGAICHRRNKKHGDVEVLLLTSRDTGRWVIPKGWPMEGKKAHAVAEREAFEEAGVRGTVQKEPFGFFHYEKKLKNGVKVTCLVQVHLLEVADLIKNFPERESRKLEWVSPEEAEKRVNEIELKQLFVAFGKHMARTAPPLPQKAANS